MNKISRGLLCLFLLVAFDLHSQEKTKNKVPQKPIKSWTDKVPKPEKFYAGHCNGYIIFKRKACYTSKLGFWSNWDNSCIDILEVVDPDCERAIQ